MANPEIELGDARPLVIGGGYNAYGKTILTGQDLKAGSVLGVITVGEKLKLCGVGNADGSEVGRFILTKDVDASLGDVIDQAVLKAGVVNGNLLIFAGVETLADHVAATGLSHDDNLKANGIIAVEGSDLELYDNT